MTEKFTATESSSAPIILGKDPIPKPEIWRGEFEFTPGPGDTVNEAIMAITFSAPSEGEKFILTFHDVPIRDWYPDGRILAKATPETVITWEKIR